MGLIVPEEIGQTEPKEFEDQKPAGNPAKPAISLPDGVEEAWLLEKCRHLNGSFDKWFVPDYLPKIEENYRVFEGKEIQGMIKGSTNIPVPNSVIETSAARYGVSLIPREKYVDAIPKSPDVVLNQDEQKNQTVEDFTNETIVTTPDHADKMDEVFKTMLLETVGVVEFVWDEQAWVDSVEDVQTDPLTGMPVTVGSKIIEKRVGRPNYLPVSIRQLAWDPREKVAIENSPWLRKRSMVSGNEMIRMQNDGIIENVEYALKKATKVSTQGQDTAKDPDGRQSQNVENNVLPAVGFDDGVYQLDEWHVTLTWKDSQGQFQTGDFQWWIVGGECLIKFRPNPLKPVRKPFASVKLNRKPGMLLAQGPMDVIKSMVIDLANTVTYWNRLVKRAATQTTYYTPSSGLDGRRRVLEDNDMIPVLSIAGIKDAEVPVQAINMVKEKVAFLINQIRDATAANEQAQGISGENEGTATEANILAGSSNLRFQYSSDLFNFTMLGKIAKNFFWMWKQFGIPGQMVVRQAGIDGKAIPVSLQDLSGDYDFRGIPSQGMSAKLKRAELMMSMADKMAQAQTANPALFTDQMGQPMAVDFFEFYKTQILPMMDIKSTKGLFKPAPPIPIMAPGALPAQAGPDMGKKPDSAPMLSESMQ